VGQVFFQNLTGANCHLSGQAIVSLHVSEDVDADYDTASVVCIAPDGPHGKGTVVTTTEGGVQTGQWEVEDPVISISGEKTWRRKDGSGAYAHVPLVSYKLRRAGYMRARSTLSKQVVGSDNYPPKFCTISHFNEIDGELRQQYTDRIIDGFEYRKQRSAWHPVYGAEYIVAAIAGWVGLSFAFRARLTGCADEYIPVDKPAITAIREVAAWSGASVMLDRSGTLQIFNWEETFGRGGSQPGLRAVTEYEAHDGLSSVNHVTVVGETYSARDSRPGWIYYQPRKTYPLEVTEQIALAPGEKIVSDRIEVRSYPITPLVARSMARERLARGYLAANASRWTGPAEGCQGMRPLENRVLGVTRSLVWNGHAYRYEIAVAAARGAVPFAGGWSSMGREYPNRPELNTDGWW